MYPALPGIFSILKTLPSTNLTLIEPNPNPVFPKLFELANHKTLNKMLADHKIFKKNREHEKEICSSIIDYFNKNLLKILVFWHIFVRFFVLRTKLESLTDQEMTFLANHDSWS
jgi:hypothetical protein